MRIERKERPDWVKGIITIVMHGSLPCATVYFRNGFIEIEAYGKYQNAKLTQGEFTVERVEDIVLPNGIIVASQLRTYDMSQLSADPVRPTKDNVKRALEVLKLKFKVDDDGDEYTEEVYHEELLSYLVVSKNLIHVYKEMVEENAIDEPLFPVLIDVLERQDAPNHLGTKLNDMFIHVTSGKMVSRRELPAYLWDSKLVAACVDGTYILHPDVLVQPRRDVPIEMIYDAESTALGGNMPMTFADWLALAKKNTPLKMWRESYYPKEASKTSPWQEAAEHSLQKWRGLDREVLDKYGLTLDREGGFIRERHGGRSMVIIGSETCALCLRHLQSEKILASERCGTCPLFLAAGVSCDYAESPYREASRTGNVQPLVRALEHAVQYCKEKPYYTPRPGDNSTTD